MTGSFDRFTRQAGLIPIERLAELEVTVVGIGAIGRQVSLQLTALGVRRLRLVDFDSVEPTNVTTQGYLHENIGISKVAATAGAAWQIDPLISIALVHDCFRPHLTIGDALFCCVDSIAARAAIWRAVGGRCGFWCDGRMLGEVMRILTVADRHGRDHYPTTLFEASEAHAGSCTARGTIYTAAIAAGLMVHQFTRWLRSLPIDASVAVNLLASEMIVEHV